MSNVSHGVNANKQATSVITPVVADSGIHFVVGTAPVHAVGGKVNEVIMASSYAEAVQALGYSDDWKKYSLCEEIYTAFMLFNVSPVFFVNVLDPKKHKKTVAAKQMDIVDNQIVLPLEALADTVEVTDMEKGEDFDVFYSDTNCVVEFLKAVSGNKAEVKYSAVDPTMVTKDEIIGGYSVSTHKTTGLELINTVFPRFTKVPDIILCPNWSHDSEVAAVMSAKAENINGLFEAVAILDVDTEEGSGATYYTEVPEWKKKKNFTKKTEIICFPKVALGEKTFNLSTQLASSMSVVDNTEMYGGGTPCESASNKGIQADRMVVANGDEVVMDLQQANYLNENGVVTALNFFNGFVSWGNYTACYPANTDITDYFYCINRMFKWVGKTAILTYWNYVDRGIKRRILDAILQSMNDWLNSLTADEKILGGRIELNESENSATALMAGIVRFHVYMTPPSPMQQLDFILEYDMSYLTAMMAA
ncbi:MAG: phage tail sheath family protein [Phascolarctobacterium sp.]|nr:phage tail sheath family protein [Candidatus Phascolarctobacterium caballi]